MEIRKSTEQDFKRIMEIYALAREYMKTHGNPNQWGPTNWKKELVPFVLTGLFQNAATFV